MEELTELSKDNLSELEEIKPQFEEIIKDKKFAGVKDNKTGITYHHARYKGPLGVNDRLITDHPEFNKVKDLNIDDYILFRNNVVNKSIETIEHYHVLFKII